MLKDYHNCDADIFEKNSNWDYLGGWNEPTRIERFPNLTYVFLKVQMKWLRVVSQSKH